MSKAKGDLSRFEIDPRFLQRIEKARRSLKNGKGVKLEDIPTGTLKRIKR